jgi:DNA-binding NtrC family response regulator
VRLIAATHQNLEKLIAEGKFREDLFYRLNVISIALPPLRERADDIIELALYFLNRAAERAGKRISHLDDDVIGALTRFSWPGNIRELENAIERSVVMAEGPAITFHDLPAVIVASTEHPGHILETKPVLADPVRSDRSGRQPLATGAIDRYPSQFPSERQSLVQALARSNGNKAEAARLLGIPRSTLFSRLKKFGME